MSITEVPNKINHVAYLVISAILLVILGFGIGRLVETGKKEGVSISYDPEFVLHATTLFGTTTPKVIPSSTNTASVYASSQGKRYYYQTCKSSISEKNKITFATKELAEKAGYTLATNCKR
ncbi:MAG: hypothetical protein JWL80_552 [Parcubacteria group bacterium]|nr:hypothetical protein [Parcubacteria group bacterium]